MAAARRAVPVARPLDSHAPLASRSPRLARLNAALVVLANRGDALRAQYLLSLGVARAPAELTAPGPLRDAAASGPGSSLRKGGKVPSNSSLRRAGGGACGHCHIWLAMPGRCVVSYARCFNI